MCQTAKFLGASRDVVVRAGLRLLWLVVVEKELVCGSKETMAKWCETCFPLQAELSLCACVPKAVLLVPHKQRTNGTAWLGLWNHLVSYRNQQV